MPNTLFRWPWMSRRAHEETVALLQAQINELRDEKRRFADVIFEQVNGKPLYSVPLTPTTEAQPLPKQAQVIDNPIEQAKQEIGTGGKARAVVLAAQKKIDLDFAKEIHGPNVTASAELQDAIERGRAAATPAAVN